MHGSSEIFVFVLLAEFSVCGSSQFQGAPRECISTDGGFNWSVGFKNKLYASAACYFHFCLLLCLCVILLQDNQGAQR